MKIIETSGTFNPSDYGLIAGDVLDIICVGGGQSGANFIAEGGHSEDYEPVDGTESSFGSYLSSASGVKMAYGEAGNESANGGAGGYLPGIPYYGGNGGSPVGLAGTIETPVSPYCNTVGPGNKGARAVAVSDGTPSRHPSGNGYGAGAASGLTSSSYKSGDAGKIAFGSAVLPNTNSISVTVGSGGVSVGTSVTSYGAPGVVIVFW